MNNMISEEARRKMRVQIIDISHLFYKFAYGGGPNLTTTLMIDGVPTVVQTTIPALTIKAIHRWSKGGVNPTVVCFDSLGSNKCRKAYFTQGNMLGASGEVYKGSRTPQGSMFYDSVNLTKNLLYQGGVTVLTAEKYEADDLIKAAVDKAKVTYPDLPIDIITGDQDFLPLVDEQVSVFLSSPKYTWAEEKSIEKNHYVQIRPSNYQSYIENLTEFKNLNVPYNTVLLKKLLRGKKADDIPGYPKFTPTKYNKLIADMQADNVDFASIFRYGAPTSQVINKYTGEAIPADMVDKLPRDLLMQKFLRPAQLDLILTTLSKYLDNDVLKHVEFIYNGINLNGAFTGLGVECSRRPARLTVDIKGYDEIALQQAVDFLKINLPALD